MAKKNKRSSKKRFSPKRRKKFTRRSLHLDKKEKLKKPASASKSQLAKSTVYSSKQLEIPVASVSLKEYHEQGLEAYRRRL